MRSPGGQSASGFGVVVRNANAKCVRGEMKGARRKIISSLETTWETWLLFNARPTVLSDDTGAGFDYSVYPYGAYRETNNIAFPLAYEDDRKHKKERVFCVMMNDQAKVFSLDNF